MKKILALAACLMLLGAITVNGTFAFSLGELFSNVFGGPNQAEENQLDVKTLIRMRKGNELIAEQNQMLIPANMPDTFDWNHKPVSFADGNHVYALWNIGGAVDKFISVENSGSEYSAYFRTAISVRCTGDEEFFRSNLKFNLNDTDYIWSDWQKTGSDTYTNVATYRYALAPGETSPAMLLQIALDKSMTNEEMEKFGADFEINVHTAAIDVTTFAKNELTTAEAALNAAVPVSGFLN